MKILDISDISFQVEEEDFSPAHPLGQAVGGSILKDLDNWCFLLNLL